MSIVNISINIEITMTRHANKKGNNRFIKIGNTLLTDKISWYNDLKNSRQVHL